MRPELNRRDFHKLTAAAVGGILAGSTLGCGREEKPKAGQKPAGANTGHGVDEGGSSVAQSTENDWLGDVHVCRGLNACKNKGKPGTTNECAGQGACHTLKSDHSCHGENDCKFQGGCGSTAGRNECAKKGNCSVPLMDDAWKGARAAFEEAMKKTGKKFGDPPPAAES